VGPHWSAVLISHNHSITRLISLKKPSNQGSILSVYGPRVRCAGIYVRVARTTACSCGPRSTFLSPWQQERTETTSMKQSGTVSSIPYLHVHSLTVKKIP
jgi:hypothetical protein